LKPDQISAMQAANTYDAYLKHETIFQTHDQLDTLHSAWGEALAFCMEQIQNRWDL